MKNKRVKQMIVDTIIPNRRMFWFGETTEKFIANSIDDVIEMHRNWLGDEEVKEMLKHECWGELKLETSPKHWFNRLCYDLDSRKATLAIDSIMAKGCYQVSTGYL